MSRLFVVSNRVADLHSPNSAAFGGLAMAMAQALKNDGGYWFGWSGETSDDADGQPRLSSAQGITLARFDLTPRQVEEYYNGFANRTLWPLCHYRTDLTAYEQSFRETYTDVNRTFAKAIHKVLKRDDVIWIHDYHLIPLGRELRALGVQNRIGFFLHIPWPAREVFVTLPQHEELVWSLFAYDLVGFQSHSALRAFEDYVSSELGVIVGSEGMIDVFGRKLQARCYPIGIDPSEMGRLAGSNAGSLAFEQLRTSNPGRKILLGVDRIDYSKGLPNKFSAYSRFLERYPERRSTTHFLQIGQPSRHGVQDYQDLAEHLIAEAGRINGAYGRINWTPLKYLTQSYPRDALAGIYRAADVALVTPLRDGMNLVAKEFIAAQCPEDPGVLILSRFAGAAEQMPEALLVNPYSYEQCAEAIAQALDMPREERQARWTALNATVEQNNLTSWKDRFLADLRASSEGESPSSSALRSSARSELPLNQRPAAPPSTQVAGNIG